MEKDNRAENVQKLIDALHGNLDIFAMQKRVARLREQTGGERK